MIRQPALHQVRRVRQATKERPGATGTRLPGARDLDERQVLAQVRHVLVRAHSGANLRLRQA